MKITVKTCDECPCADFNEVDEECNHPGLCGPDGALKCIPGHWVDPGPGLPQVYVKAAWPIPAWCPLRTEPLTIELLSALPS